ncbi:TonB-linked SusC/RagA family outer membrane protein [Ulvibacter sp. MAR_2010_11]|uniref:SusC/RagA family TonB-linked outer membrane protein n=1 Tax=Ulvibacter sp. MAR_2010_11 TaxID=1250229 RepID=UPI000C2C2C1B|nr:SusC/RagA family TonB-linked outer membrane protein [Ulvibacter sp. MAR_2010_11]PKA83169.1 TonB-linked SusC/RagA family outer membrane protein [Ulvibacter sp. MAR_2010_11]
MKQKNSNSRRLLLLLFLFPCFVFAQTTLTGKISDPNGTTVPFANVIEKGTTNGTTTDIDGNFSISVASLPATLVFSSLGYETIEQTANNASPMNITLAESAEALSEVVVTGLATSIKRSNSANAVASISAEELVGTTPPPTLDGALYGKFAGAVVNANSGAPGGGLSIKLRGATSLQGNTSPLYIIDGVYVDNSSIQPGLNLVSAAAAGGSASNQDNPTNRIADINPEDIANIEILKGASAAAIYGSRAAAGVVIITTKRGKAGETLFKFNQSTGWTEAINLLGLRDYNEQRVRDTFGEAAVAQFVAARNEGRLIDYEKEIYGEKGFLSNTNFSMSGGDVKSKFYAGVSHNNEQGIVNRTGYEKTSLRLNLDHKATDYLKLSLSTNYIYSRSDRGFFNNDNSGTTIGVTLTGTTPWLQLFPDANGVYPDNPSGASNPLQTRDLVTNRETVNRIIMGGSANLDIYKADNSSLELILRGGVDFYGQQSRAIFPKALQFQKLSNGGLNGVSVQGETQNKNYNLSAFLVHNFNTASDISFRTQAGLTNEFFDQNTQLISATGLVASETNVDQAANTGVNQTRLRQEDSGFFVQEEINFQDKFIATFGVRGDKSSNNGDANKLNYYPKGSLAVNLNEFGFWSDGSKWNQFKLRAAYGEAGNFPPFGALFTSYNAFTTDGLLGISLIGIRGDKTLKSERQKELEFGTDIAFFNNRLSLSGTYYIKTIDDLILRASLEPSTGFTTEFVNAGELQNKGIEISLNTTPVMTDDFQWDLGVNFFQNRSEITRLDVEPFNVGAFGATLGTYRIEEGSSATQIVGIGPNPGDNGFQKFGDSEADFQMSFNNSLNYKSLQLTFLWHWKKGGDNVNLTTLLSDLNGTTHDYDDVALDPDGVLGNGDYRLSQLGSSAEVFVEDASYLRLRELGLYYSLPDRLLSGIIGGNIDAIKLGVSGTNLINIFDYNSYDPEVSNFGGGTIFTGVEVTPFPSSKRILFHLGINF